MTTGSQLARDLAHRRSEIEGSLRQVAGKINVIEGELGRIMAEEGRLWNEFASIQLGEATELPAQIERMLEKRARRLKDAEAAVEESRKVIAGLEKERGPAAKAAEKDREAGRALERKLAEAFEADPEAAALRVKAVALEGAIDSLKGKLERAREEYERKAPDYHRDELFSYLQRRGWDEPGYSGWGLARRLDGWLASLVSYRRKAAELKRLAEIPAWIMARLDKVAAERDEIEGRLDGMREKAFEPLRPLAEAAKASAAALADIDRRLREEEDAVRKQSSYIANAALASDQEMQEATKAFARMLSGKGFLTLAEAAASTSTTKDDEIVDRLEKLALERRGLETQVEQLRPGLFEFERRAKAIEEVERKLRSRGWTGSDDRFSSLVKSGSVDELADGLVTAAAFWSMLQSAYQEPPRISVRRTSRSSWDSGSSGGFGGDSWSSGGGFGGGSWSSGGGFGGGGSSTGGGF